MASAKATAFTLPYDASEIGGKGIRTPDLLIANETLYQLSYTPRMASKLARRKKSSSEP